MKVLSMPFALLPVQKKTDNKEKKYVFQNPPRTHIDSAHINLFKNYFIPFKGYYGDRQPLKKLFWISTGRNDVYEDNWTKEHIYTAGDKKWVNASPAELLTRTPEQLIQSVCTLTKPDMQYPGIPSYIPSPDYGDKWGRFANYIEINPRLVAKFEGDRISEGLLGVMKLLPAIPPSGGKCANCIVLSQLYPT